MVFPARALLRLGGMVLVENHTEWQVCVRRYLSEYYGHLLAEAVEIPR